MNGRLKYHLSNALKALSLVMLMATLALWVCSLWTAGVLIWDFSGGAFVVHCQKNLIGVRLYRDDQSSDSGWSLQLYPNPESPRNTGLWDELRLPGGWTLPQVGLGYRRDQTNKRYGWRLGNRPIYNF